MMNYGMKGKDFILTGIGTGVFQRKKLLLTFIPY